MRRSESRKSPRARRRITATVFSTLALCTAVLAGKTDPTGCTVTTANPEWVEPASISPVNNLTFANLVVRFGVNTIGTDRVRHRSYNGEPVGPVIRTRPGAELIINLENRLPPDPVDIEPPADLTPPKAKEVPPLQPPNAHAIEIPHGFNTTNLHTHGLHVSPNSPSDNVFLAVDPLVNKQATYRFTMPADHPSGTFWYHAHKHGSVGYQLASGMAGALIVEGGEDDYLKSKGIKSEKVMVFQQITYRLIPGRDAEVFPKDIYGLPGLPGATVPKKSATLINGQLVPIIRMRPGEVQRFRMIHAGIETSIYVHLDGHTLYEIALDGIPLKELRALPYVDLEPGYRSDVLVKASATPGTYCLYNEVPKAESQGALRALAVSRANLAVIVVEGDPVSGVPDIGSPEFAAARNAWAKNYLEVQLPQFKDIEAAEVTNRRCLTMKHDGPQVFYVDDRTFDEKRIDQTIALNAVEEWTVQAVLDSHPFHIHVNPFQVQEQYPDRSLKWVWRDTYLVKQGQAIKIRSRFLDFDGKTVLHCHNLDHEDQGMMQAIAIVDAKKKGAGGVAPSGTGLSNLPTRAPEWTLSDSDGHQVRRADYKGRSMLLILHRGLDCLHCASQITSLARSATAFQALGVEIVAVSPKWPDPEQVRAVRERLRIRFPLLADPRHEVFRIHGCHDGQPLHGAFLIDAAGEVRWQSVSELPETDMDRLLEAARKHVAPSPIAGESDIPNRDGP